MLVLIFHFLNEYFSQSKIVQDYVRAIAAWTRKSVFTPSACKTPASSTAIYPALRWLQIVAVWQTSSVPPVLSLQRLEWQVCLLLPITIWSWRWGIFPIPSIVWASTKRVPRAITVTLFVQKNPIINYASGQPYASRFLCNANQKWRFCSKKSMVWSRRVNRFTCNLRSSPTTYFLEHSRYLEFLQVVSFYFTATRAPCIHLHGLL